VASSQEKSDFFQFWSCLQKKDNTPPESIVKTVLRYNDFSSKATQWGRKHEPAARRKYTLSLGKTHDNFKVSECGLLVCENMPYLGASPDGLVECSCCGMGVLEVKCPFKYRYQSPVMAAKDTDFYLNELGHELQLKKNHNYYFQVQGQLAISGRKFCEFVVWTLQGYSVERICFDPQLWQDMSQTLQSFYLNCIMPELWSERVKRGNRLKWKNICM